MEENDQHAVCVRCNEPITEDNDSFEHVIQNSVGGKLKTKGFICTKCNNTAGEDWDSEFARQMNPLCLFFGIIRDRGISPAQTFETSAGEKIRIRHDGSLALDRPIYREVPHADGMKVEITARTMSEARKMLATVKRKYPRTDISGILDNVAVNTSYLNGAVKLDLQFGGEKAGRSFVKTAAAFAHFNGIPVSVCDLARSYLCESSGIVPFGYFYEDDLIAARPKGVPLHCVAISANAKTGLLLGYVEYFGVVRVVTCLSNRFEGRQLNCAYAIDPMNSTVLNLSVRLPFSKSDIEAIYNYQRFPDGALQRVVAEVIPTGLKKKFEIEKNRAIHDAVEYAFANCGAKYGETLNQDQMKKLSALVIEKMMPFIMRNLRRPA